ncbi:MAG: hypothetical protein IPJ88_15010 [Myxococcales bacterium]|nr:MAG: hypothetical protein IPJ88_15010 [Myxococcales bacterium]
MVSTLLAPACVTTKPTAHPQNINTDAATRRYPPEASGERADFSTRTTSFVDPVSPAGQRAQGIYLTGPLIRRYKTAKRIAQLAKQSHANAVVIDMKDDQGRVFFPTKIAELQRQRVNHIENPKKLIAELKKEGIYTIGRLVCFSDPKLPSREPERAILDTRQNKRDKPWVSWGNGSTWLNPWHPANHAMIVQMAKEVAALGIDEVQLDYIRFPVDPGTRFAKYPFEKQTLRRFVLRDLLRKVDESIRVPLSVDVFGLTAFRTGDPTGLGQSLEDWTDYVEIFSPMLYTNNMKSWGRHVKTARAFALVNAGVRQLRQRLGPEPIIRPFLQAFAAGADYYNADFISEQVIGSRLAGADGFLFWNPASNYGTVSRAMRRSKNRSPFPIKKRMQQRSKLWSNKSK